MAKEMKPGEQIWDHAFRLIFESIIVGQLLETDNQSANFRKTLSHCVGVFAINFNELKSAFFILIQQKENYKKLFTWEEHKGEFYSQLITNEDEHILLATINLNFAFKNFIISWQPLLDSLASLILLVFDDKKIFNYNKKYTIFRLSEALKNEEIKIENEKLIKCLTTDLDWYKSDLRLLRNQLVHNVKVAHVLPHHDGNVTYFEFKTLYDEPTSDKIHFEKYANWLFGKFFLMTATIYEEIKNLKSN